jgi:hypothetical protein
MTTTSPSPQVVATTILVSVGVVTPFHLYLDFSLVFQKFQIWYLLPLLPPLF